VLVSNRIEMRQDELADPCLLGYLSALSGVQMDRAWSIGRERTVENGKIGISAETHEAGAILGVA